MKVNGRFTELLKPGLMEEFKKFGTVVETSGPIRRILVKLGWAMPRYVFIPDEFPSILSSPALEDTDVRRRRD